MDALNIALLGGGMMPGLGGNAVLPEMPADAESFGSVLGGMMTAVPASPDAPAQSDVIRGMSIAAAAESRTPVTADAVTAAADAPAKAFTEGMSIASALDRDFTFSAGTENAMMNFIGSYFKADTSLSGNTSSSFTDTESLMSGWQEMLTNMGSGEISQLSAFTSELETALFSGTKYGTDEDSLISDILESDDITWTAADVFIDVLGNRTKKKNNPDSDIGMMLAQTIAASGYTGFDFTDLMKIGESGDIMGTYTDRTVKNITAAAMKSVFGEDAANEALTPDISTVLGNMLMKNSTGSAEAAVIADTAAAARFADIVTKADIARGTETAAEASVVREEYAPATFEEAAELIRGSTDEAVEGFTRLLSDTVKEYIEENGIEGIEIVQTVRPAESNDVKAETLQSTVGTPDVPTQELPVPPRPPETFRRINRTDVPQTEENIPKVNLPQRTEDVRSGEQAPPPVPEHIRTQAPEHTPARPPAPVIRETEDTDAPQIRTDAEITGKADFPQTESREMHTENTAAAAESTVQQVHIPQHTANTEEAPADIFTEETARSVNVQTAEAIIARIDENSRTGDTEITVRLNPRSLGEITVRVSKASNGDVSVTLAAHNPETAKLLNDHANELAQLLNDRRDTHAQVNVVDPAQAGSYASLDMGGSDSFYFGQGGNGGTGNTRSGGNGGDTEDIAAVDADEEKIYISEEARLWTTA